MIKILLVDDERPVVEAMQHLIERDLGDRYEVCGSAANGREAVEKSFLLQPRVILMDIHMPGLNGLDAIREIRKRQDGVVFILLTAYERFDIAQEAVGLGVHAYLTKPVPRERLVRTLRDLALHNLDDDEPEAPGPGERERQDAWRHYTELAFVQSVVLGQDWDRAGGPIARHLGLVDDCFFMVALAIRARDDLPGISGGDETWEALSRTLRFKTQALIGGLVGGMVPLCMPVRKADQAPQERARLEELFRQYHGRDIERGLLSWGIGEPGTGNQLSESWSQALKDLGKSRRDRSGSPALDQGSLYLGEEEANFLSALEEGDRVLGRLSLEKLLAPFQAVDQVSLADRFRFISLLGMVYRHLYREQRINDGQFLDLMDLEPVYHAPNGHTLVQVIRSCWFGLMQELRTQARYSKPVAHALDQIRNHFAEPLSLESLALECSVSPSRLSRLFIDETGKGFSDYLIQVRIDHARHLLSQPGATVKSVSAACGYPDANYFARLFKKVTGLTPSGFSSQSETEVPPQEDPQ